MCFTSCRQHKIYAYCWKKTPWQRCVWHFSLCSTQCTQHKVWLFHSELLWKFSAAAISVLGYSGVNYGRNASKTCNGLHNDPCYFAVQSCQPACCQSNKTKTKQQLAQLAPTTNPNTVCIRSWDKTQQHLKALHLITIFLSGCVSHFNDSEQGANLPRFFNWHKHCRIRSSSLSASAIRHPIPLSLSFPRLLIIVKGPIQPARCPLTRCIIQSELWLTRVRLRNGSAKQARTAVSGEQT